MNRILLLRDLILSAILEHNPYHDEKGRFTSAAGSAFGAAQAGLAHQRGLSQREIWRLRKQASRIKPITKDSKCEITGKKTKLHRHHVDGNIRNNDPKNLMIVTESEHIKIHQAAGTYVFKGVKIAAD